MTAKDHLFKEPLIIGVPSIALLLYSLDQLTILRCKEKGLPEKPADYN